MWIELTVIDEQGTETKCPINMDNVVTYTLIATDQYPTANTVLYTNCMFVQTMPVVETVAEITDKMKEKS